MTDQISPSTQWGWTGNVWRLHCRCSSSVLVPIVAATKETNIKKRWWRELSSRRRNLCRLGKLGGTLEQIRTGYSAAWWKDKTQLRGHEEGVSLCQRVSLANRQMTQIKEVVPTLFSAGVENCWSCLGILSDLDRPYGWRFQAKVCTNCRRLKRREATDDQNVLWRCWLGLTNPTLK